MNCKGIISYKFNGDVNCQTLFLKSSKFVLRLTSYVERISVDYLIEDDIADQLNSNIAFFVKQYSYYCENIDNLEKEISLTFEDGYPDLVYGSNGFSLENRGELGLILSASSLKIKIGGGKINKKVVIKCHH